MKYSDYYDISFHFRIIGEKGVGKSSLLARFTDGVYDENIKFSLGMDFRTKIVKVNRKFIRLQLWDLVTQKNIRYSNQSFYRGQHGIFLIFDISRRETFDRLQRWVDQIDEHDDIVKILIGNKSDLTNIINQEEIQSFANFHQLTYIETSAKTGYNVEKMFTDATEKALENLSKGIYSDPCQRYYLEPSLMPNKLNICC